MISRENEYPEDDGKVLRHASDCSTNNAPAYPNGPCDCPFGPYIDRIELLEREKAEREDLLRKFNRGGQAALGDLIAANTEADTLARALTLILRKSFAAEMLLLTNQYDHAITIAKRRVNGE